MRILVTSTAGLGHIHPMVPLVRAMAARGHEVRWAIPADGVEHVERAGITAIAAGPAMLAHPVEARRLYPEIAALPPEEQPSVMFGKLFGAIAAPAILADLAPLALDWRPDLVVADAAEFAGHLVAAELGVPSVTKAFGPLLPAPRVTAAGEEVARLWRSRGLEPRPFGGAYDHLYVDIYPPELAGADASHIPRRQLMSPVTDDGQPDASSPLPPPLPLPRGASGSPLVYVTLGTVFNDVAPLRTAVAGLRHLDVRVLVTVGPRGDPAELAEQPAHVRVERYVPQTAVLPRCDVVVSHGGSGTMLASARLGIPQLCLPQGADQFLNAEAVASAGAGLSLAPREADEGAIRDAVVRLLADASFRDAAGRVGASIAAMPSPDEVVAVLETLP
jgi:UDP:flavonoid glycosyltransferase YjiC (YdhE family)